MNILNKNTVVALAAMLTGCMLVSCDNIVDFNNGYTPADQQANQGAPVINAVYDVADTACLTPIIEGQLGQTVRLVGTNLNNVSRITFNTVEVDLNEVYTLYNAAIVRIPMTLSRSTDNVIQYTTDQGTATFAFTIPFPQLVVDGLYNEFAAAGDSVTITGENFNLYEFGTSSRVMIGDRELGLGSITATSMKALVPQGTPDNSTITVSWQDPQGNDREAQLPFRPSTNLLYGDFSQVQMNVDGGINVDRTGGYLHLTGEFGAWAWNTIDLSCNMIDMDVDNVDDYVLKMEVLTQSTFPLTGDSPLQFCFNWGGSYTWTPGNGSGLNTLGQWKTITLPLAPMATNGISSRGSWQTLRIVFQPHSEYTADFSLANIRIVRQ